jgi:hypothetical protein
MGRQNVARHTVDPYLWTRSHQICTSDADDWSLTWPLTVVYGAAIGDVNDNMRHWGRGEGSTAAAAGLK